MKIEEAIEFIEKYRFAKNSKTDEIIKLLLEGKSYRQMWEELEKNTTSEYGLSMNGEDFVSMRKMIKEKYLSKEVTND